MNPSLKIQLDRLSDEEKLEALRYLRDQVEFEEFRQTFRESIERKFARPMGTYGSRTCPHCNGPL